jgi:hypothetical protein
LVFLGICTQFFVSCLWLLGLRVALENSTTQAQAVQTAYNSSQQELEELRAAALEACQESRKARRKLGARWRVASVPSEDHVWFDDRWMVASLCDE